MRVSEFNNTLKYLKDLGPKKGISFDGALSSTTYAKLVRVTQRTVGLLYLGGWVVVSWRGQVNSEFLLHQFLGFANRRGLESP